jgi:hypothetical protein
MTYGGIATNVPLSVRHPPVVVPLAAHDPEAMEQRSTTGLEICLA